MTATRDTFSRDSGVYIH